jgi:hypothetical protein
MKAAASSLVQRESSVIDAAKMLELQRGSLEDADRTITQR